MNNCSEIQVECAERLARIEQMLIEMRDADRENKKTSTELQERVLKLELAESKLQGASGLAGWLFPFIWSSVGGVVAYIASFFLKQH